MNKIKFVVGPNFRSKNGCNSCKSRRRKCDEAFPRCNFCQQRELECVYKTKPKGIVYDTDKVKVKKVRKDKRKPKFERVMEMGVGGGVGDGTSSVGSKSGSVPSGSDLVSGGSDLVRGGGIVRGGGVESGEKVSVQAGGDLVRDSGVLVPQRRIVLSAGKSPGESSDSDLESIPNIVELQQDLQQDLDQYDMDIPSFSFDKAFLDSDFLEFSKIFSPSITTPSSIPSLYLDDSGIRYLDHFQQHVSKELAISFDNMNYFKKLFLSLANTEETFTYMLAAWGALYLRNQKFDREVSYYINKGEQKFKQLFGSKINDFDTYFQLCFTLIKYQMLSCSGEVKMWKVYFDESIKLVQDYGGMLKLSKDFGFSNDIRFIISMIQYCDIMSSDSLLNGTQIPIEEYEQVFNDEGFKKNELSYGIDTVQGVHQSVLLLLGTIMNHKVILDRKLLELQNDQDEQDSPLDGEYEEVKTEQSTNDIESDYYQMVNKFATDLKYQIDNVEPNYVLLNSIEDPDQKDIHIKAYELYKNICEIYRLLYICQTPPKNYQIRLLIRENCKYIDRLMNTKMTVILCLPLTMCGICAMTKQEKEFVRTRSEIVMKLSPVKNMDKAWAVVQRAWELTDGETVVDWGMICKEFGWELNIC